VRPLHPDELPAGSEPSPRSLGCAHFAILLRTEASRAWWACRDCDTPFIPAAPAPAIIASPAVLDDGEAREYLSVRELAQQIPYREGTIRNLMSQGRLRLGVHYVKPLGRVMFRRSAVLAWLDGQRPEA
jgi:hypothetical protein